MKRSPVFLYSRRRDLLKRRRFGTKTIRDVRFRVG